MAGVCRWSTVSVGGRVRLSVVIGRLELSLVAVGGCVMWWAAAHCRLPSANGPRRRGFRPTPTSHMVVKAVTTTETRADAADTHTMIFEGEVAAYVAAGAAARAAPGHTLSSLAARSPTPHDKVCGAMPPGHSCGFRHTRVCATRVAPCARRTAPRANTSPHTNRVWHRARQHGSPAHNSVCSCDGHACVAQARPHAGCIMCVAAAPWRRSQHTLGAIDTALHTAKSRMAGML